MTKELESDRKKVSKLYPEVPAAQGYKSKQQEYGVTIETTETVTGKQYLIPKPNLQKRDERNV